MRFTLDFLLGDSTSIEVSLALALELSDTDTGDSPNSRPSPAAAKVVPHAGGLCTSSSLLLQRELVSPPPSPPPLLSLRRRQRLRERKECICSNAAMQLSWSRNNAMVLTGVLLPSSSSRMPFSHSKNGFCSLMKKYSGIDSNQLVQDIFSSENEISRADIAIVEGAYRIEADSKRKGANEKVLVRKQTTVVK